MSLFQFLSDNKAEILALSERRVLALAALRPVSPELQLGLLIFFDQLVVVLAKNREAVSPKDEQDILETAGSHGKELLRLGYTLSHVVHAYGAICQAITEQAGTMQAPVTALEFHHLNRCLDIAIAGAVTEFETARNLQTKGREVESLGIMAHELRNSLNRATVSSEMIAKGIVGVGGSTAKVLQYSLIEMDRIITRALSEVRLRAHTDTHEERFCINEIISQLVVTAEVEASLRGLTLTLQVDENLEIKADRHLLLSALGNLVQNAMKFTKAPGNITITVRRDGYFALLEVKDQCGGIPAEKISIMFEPFSQQGKDRSGLGLGLIISRKAVEKCHGTLVAFNSDEGCVFRISIPRVETNLTPSTPPVV